MMLFVVKILIKSVVTDESCAMILAAAASGNGLADMRVNMMKSRVSCT